MPIRISWVEPDGIWKPAPRNTSESTPYTTAVVHFLVGSSRLTRSVMMPHTTMPLPTARTKIDAIAPALSGARPYERLKKLGSHASRTPAVNICRPPPMYASTTAGVEKRLESGARKPVGVSAGSSRTAASVSFRSDTRARNRATRMSRRRPSRRTTSASRG